MRALGPQRGVAGISTAACLAPSRLLQAVNLDFQRLLGVCALVVDDNRIDEAARVARIERLGLLAAPERKCLVDRVEAVVIIDKAQAGESDRSILGPDAEGLEVTRGLADVDRGAGLSRDQVLASRSAPDRRVRRSSLFFSWLPHP